MTTISGGTNKFNFQTVQTIEQRVIIVNVSQIQFRERKKEAADHAAVQEQWFENFQLGNTEPNRWRSKHEAVIY